MKSTTPNNFVLNSQPRHWDELSKFEKDNYLLKRHGPKHMEKSVAVGMTIFYGSL